MRNRLKNFRVTAVIATLVLLAALGVEGRLRPQPTEAEPYHERVRQAVLNVPMDLDDWLGQNNKVPYEAQQLLKPNALYSRSFLNRTTGEQVGVLIVHCKDARDIYGHYPPVCYPAHGMNERENLREAQELEVPSGPVPYTVYHFNRNGQQLIVYNCMIVRGEICRDMAVVEDRVGDYTRRFYGAAQLQVVFRGDRMEPSRQDQIFQEMIRYHLPIIEAIRSGDGT